MEGRTVALTVDMENILSVSQLNAYVREVLWRDELLRRVAVQGEIANLRNYQGHLYFTLKDQKASVRAVMWRSDASRMAFVPEEGSQVIVIGSVSVYERDGVYQIYVTHMEPYGLGALYAALEQLKRKLEKEGLFSQDRKRPLPSFPRAIGVVTSIRGAAIKDIVTCGRRRYPGVRFIVADTRVQGEGAAQEICRAIRALNAVPDVDVIIVGRGGGSQEDLWVFNDENVARTICASRVPVVSAVGHERDVTIADLVADARAPTPSAAAEMVVPDAAALRLRIEMLVEDGRSAMMTMIAGYRRTLNMLRSRPALQRPDWFLVSAREALVRLRKDMEDATRTMLEKEHLKLGKLASQLDALSPLKILSRGYSVARRAADGAIIREYSDVNPEEKVRLTLYRGFVDCTVDRVIPPEEGPK